MGFPSTQQIDQLNEEAKKMAGEKKTKEAIEDRFVAYAFWRGHRILTL
jgi:hypothetical protein